MVAQRGRGRPHPTQPDRRCPSRVVRPRLILRRLRLADQPHHRIESRARPTGDERVKPFGAPSDHRRNLWQPKRASRLSEVLGSRVEGDSSFSKRRAASVASSRGQPSATGGRAATDPACDAATAIGQRAVWHQRAGATSHSGRAQRAASPRGDSAGAKRRACRQRHALGMDSRAFVLDFRRGAFGALGSAANHLLRSPSGPF